VSDFLAAMAAASARRAAEARRAEPERELLRRALDRSPAPPLRRAPAGFDLIAEVKLRSPSAGPLAGGEEVGRLEARAAAYAGAGAAAVSVLTEPERFGGGLEHLRRVADVLAVPAMRKDFLVEPYQLLEARAAGAGGALLILGVLDDARLADMLATARDLGLFVLLEAFTAAELERAAALPRPAAGDAPVLLGLNCRDLRSLAIEPERFEALADAFPAGWPRVAESGINAAADAGRVAALGYDLALVGSALMKADDPAALVGDLLAAGRAARAP